MTKWLISALIFFFTAGELAGQSNDTLPPVNKKGLRRAAAAATLVYAGGIYGLGRLWYDSTGGSYRWFNDNKEWKQVDKIGHAYSSFYLAYGFSKGLQQYNVPERKADLIGAVCGFLVMVPIEIFDGYSPKYGGSAGDLIADAVGPLTYLLEKRLWNEIRLVPKFSFHRTAYAPLRPEVLGSGADEILKDYNGQTYWMSIDIDKFIRFPKWLNVAVGYGAEGMVYARDWQNTSAGYPMPYRQLYVALDWDLTAIQTRSPVIKTLLFFGNMIKLPAPTLIFAKKGTEFDPFYH